MSNKRYFSYIYSFLNIVMSEKVYNFIWDIADDAAIRKDYVGK